MDIRYILLIPFGFFITMAMSMVKDYCEVRYNHDQQIKKK